MTSSHYLSSGLPASSWNNSHSTGVSSGQSTPTAREVSDPVPVPTPRLQKADGPSTGTPIPAYSVVQRPYSKYSPAVPFTAFSWFFIPCGVGSESSYVAILTHFQIQHFFRVSACIPALKSGVLIRRFPIKELSRLRGIKGKEALKRI